MDVHAVNQVLFLRDAPCYKKYHSGLNLSTCLKFSESKGSQVHECFRSVLLVAPGITALSPVALAENNDDEHNKFCEQHLGNKTK